MPGGGDGGTDEEGTGPVSAQARHILDKNFPADGLCVKCGSDDLAYQGDTPYPRPTDGVLVHYEA